MPVPSSRPGCLFALLSLLGLAPKTPALDTEESSSSLAPTIRAADLVAVKQKDYFLTAAEHHFFKALLLALEGNLTVCPKVRLGDLFYVPKRMENIATANSLDRRHVDFVLCTPTNMNHCLGIELDDRSHETDKAKKRDEIVEKFFADAGLPLLRVRARAAYDPPVLALQIEAALKGGEISEEPAEEPTPVPLCPKCGVPMVLRVAGKGDHAGKPFYGCVNYPRCWAKVESLEG